MTLLEKQLEKIVQLADETAVKRLDSNIRHYQKPGHDVYMYTSTVKQDISNLIKQLTFTIIKVRLKIKLINFGYRCILFSQVR